MEKFGCGPVEICLVEFAGEAVDPNVLRMARPRLLRLPMPAPRRWPRSSPDMVWELWRWNCAGPAPVPVAAPDPAPVAPAACRSTAEENTDAACDSCAAFVAAAAEVRASLSSSSTVGQIKAARDKVTTACSEPNTALEKVGSDRADTLAAAWRELESAISNMAEGMTIPEAKETLQGDPSKVEPARKGLDADLKC